VRPRKRLEAGLTHRQAPPARLKSLSAAQLLYRCRIYPTVTFSFIL
jgi:hypothetical protein